jgi:hypothetical protein
MAKRARNLLDEFQQVPLAFLQRDEVPSATRKAMRWLLSHARPVEQGRYVFEIVGVAIEPPEPEKLLPQGFRRGHPLHLGQEAAPGTPAEAVQAEEAPPIGKRVERDGPITELLEAATAVALVKGHRSPPRTVGRSF